MPKTRKTRPRSRSDSPPTPYSQPSRMEEQHLLEWDEAICPICMEHPHNAVLLRCSSREKGCRPYICNTGARHSDCLGQFYKSASTAGHEQALDTRKSCTESIVNCPFCRGHVQGWEVVEPARKHMNSKPRSCSSKACEFSGTYAELRKHVRSEHPYVRPREVDTSSRERWSMLEQERHLADLESYALPVEEEEGVGEIRADRSAASWGEQSPSLLGLEIMRDSVYRTITVLYLQRQSINSSVAHDSSLQIAMQHLSLRGMTHGTEVQGDRSSSTAAGMASAGSARRDAEGSNSTSRTIRRSSGDRGTPYRRTRRRSH